jgi:hypothetical protein
VAITSNKKLTLQGKGYGNTVITRDGNAISMNESGSRITGIGFVLPSSDAAQIDVKGTGWRIDHCRFTNNSASSRISILVNGTNVASTPAGLIDNNDFIQGRIVVFRGSNLTEENIIWGTPHKFGNADIDGSSNVYIEDNTFYKTVSGGGNVIDANLAGSYVARYNVITGVTQFQTHSLQSSSERGTYAWEVYGNSFVASSAVYTWLYFRSGTGFIFNNAIAGAYTYGPVFDNVRSYLAVSGTGETGLCDGSSSWDGNANSNGWPCRDQIGRGSDAAVWSLGGAYTQSSIPAYLWSNIKSSSNQTVTVANGCGSWIVAGRDYYQSPSSYSSFDGSSGVGCGPLSARPTTCSTGAGYWATDQSCTSLSGMVGVKPPTPISGTLYKCTATNTWTSYYTPFTYPHPLRKPQPPQWK